MAERQLSPQQLADLIQFLGEVLLFQELRPGDLEALLTSARWEVYQPGTALYHQSEADNNLYVIVGGEVALTHIDPQGAPNDVGLRGRGDWLGEASVLLGEPHDVTAMAATEVTTLLFSRRDFEELYAAVPGFKGRLTPRDENARKLNAPHFGWQAPDESVVVFTREHSWGLIRVLLLPIGVAMAAIFVSIALAQSSPALGAGFGIVAALVLLGVFAYLFVDWRNDFYVVTNKRIVHVDAIPIIRKKREEAPLTAVSEIQFARNSVLAHLLDFGDLRVDTFSGTVSMKDIPHPNVVKDLIQREIERVRARARASERNAIRDELRKRIIKQEVTPDAVDMTPKPPARPSSQFILSGIIRYFFPPLREEQGDAIIWRKHWIKLWEVSWLPFLGMIVVVWAFINWWFRWFPIGDLLKDNNAWWIFPVLFSVTTAWWLWQFEDWRNDQYILTSTRIIDIERVPFLLSEKRRETTLSKIQTTEIKVPTPLARTLGYGILIVRVPGAVFEFNYIKDPTAAQADINRRLAEFTKRQAENEARGRRNELSDWFAAYDQLQQQLKRAVVGGDGSDGSA
jgi:hypothetical protein